MARILVAGCGYVGSRLAAFLVADGHRVFGMRRSPEALPEGVTPLAADVGDPRTLSALPTGLDHVVYAVSPGGRDPESYRRAFPVGLANLLSAVADESPRLRRLLLISSTGVYGQRDGRWVDEDTPPAPSDETAELLLEAEALVGATACEGVVLRLGGIYGPGRTGTLERVLTGTAGCPPPDRYGNRIHRDDAAGALRHLLSLASPDPLYLGVDRDPAALREVYRWIASRGGAPDPCTGPADEARVRGRRRTNKRCRGDRLAASGYDFRYPTFREGYGALLDSPELRVSPGSSREDLR